MKKQITILSYVLVFIAGICLINMTSSATAQEISTSNISRYVGNGRWDWTVFIVARPEVIENIECVEYTLHPTFPNPVRNVCSVGDPRYPFGLTTEGWGVFEISIRVIFENNGIRHLTHMLIFEAPPVEDPLPISSGNVATQIRGGGWNWTIFIEGPNEAMEQIQCVEYTLHPTFPNPIQEVCRRGTGPQSFALSATGWGTFQVRIRVFLRNGRVQELIHNLRF